MHVVHLNTRIQRTHYLLVSHKVSFGLIAWDCGVEASLDEEPHECLRKMLTH